MGEGLLSGGLVAPPEAASNPDPATQLRRTLPRKLLLLTNSVAVGGMEEHVRLIAQEIDRERFGVQAVLPDWEATNAWSTRLAAEVDSLRYVTPDRRYGIVRQLRQAVGLWRFARRERFDVAHLHGTSFHGLTVVVVVLRLAGLRRILLTEHLAPDEAQPVAARRFRRAMTRLLAGLVCVSENNREARERHLGAAACPTHVVNNGVYVSRFDEVPDIDALEQLRAELALVEGTLVVGTAIRLESDKGVDDLVRAFALAHERHPHAVLLIAGDGSQRAELEALAAELGVADATRFVGFQPKPEPYIRLMDVFVLPVPFGSASIGLLEAMAMRRACIITFGGDKEAVVHGECGFCAAPHDPMSLAHYIEQLLDSSTLRERFGRQARERVERDYSASRVARELEGLYAPPPRGTLS